jgi:hypothetical protein
MSNSGLNYPTGYSPEQMIDVLLTLENFLYANYDAIPLGDGDIIPNLYSRVIGFQKLINRDL